MISVRKAPAPLRIAVVIMATVALGYAASSVPLFVHHSSDSSVVMASWMLFFAVVNAVLALLMLRAWPWARVLTLVLYTLSVVRDASAMLNGSGTWSNSISLLVAAVVIVLLAAFGSGHRFFDSALDETQLDTKLSGKPSSAL
ncbi:MAG: hypothetical protein DLM55_05755 [Acidimicrobiales bacterium]|nr:MAG: hypothetical protein DLM55_05755 [Acidimicrobiales bacterium]